jgi:uncharacterized linocin/CFP29 family protein
MPSILKRDFAPVSSEAWEMLDEEAKRILTENLTGRRVVDFSGPHGWELGAVNLGRLSVEAKKAGATIPWGIREVQPLVEIRAPFSLRQIELDSVSRGAQDADLDPLQAVVGQAALFEDTAVFQGFDAGKITGMAKASAHKPLKLPKDGNGYPAVVSAALKAMSAEDIGGPYALVLGPDAYFTLREAFQPGYPPQKVVEDMLAGPVLKSEAVNGGLVLSTRGGDFELTVGKDFSLGYASHDREAVEFFVTESFTFRVLEPRAVVALNPPAK